MYIVDQFNHLQVHVIPTSSIVPYNNDSISFELWSYLISLFCSRTQLTFVNVTFLFTCVIMITKVLAHVGVEPMTFALLARRSNQLS